MTTQTTVTCWNCVGDGCSACGYQMPRAEMFGQLTMVDDGVNAVDLGVVGTFQYAVDFIGRATAASVWRRPAGDVGTYGGWRFECSSAHPCRYPDAHPDFTELGQRIGQALTVRSREGN